MRSKLPDGSPAPSGWACMSQNPGTAYGSACASGSSQPLVVIAGGNDNPLQVAKALIGPYAAGSVVAGPRPAGR